MDSERFARPSDESVLDYIPEKFERPLTRKDSLV